jgi:D-alanyl-D-alanine dipeptidase
MMLILLLTISCATRLPDSKGSFLKSDLVELVKLDSSIHLDMKYATSNNFMGRAVYKDAKAFLQRPAAIALVNVNKELKSLGYGLRIFDAYRPWSVTKLMWDITPAENKKFVADPRNGSRHNRGCAIDLTLYEIASGREVPMTSQFDEMTERSHQNFTGGTSEQRQMRDLLKRTMEDNGFTVLSYEWWHFDFKDWKLYRIENTPFSKIK